MPTTSSAGKNRPTGTFGPPPANSAAKAASLRTAAMHDEVMSMEHRLAELKATMGKQREMRDQNRQRNPSGTMWCALAIFFSRAHGGKQ